MAGLSGIKAAVKAVRQSPILLAVLFVALINLALTSLNPVSKVDPQSLPAAHGWTWWAAHDFLKEKEAPNVVIVGSSLMMNPIWQNEADFLEQDVDITANRRCRYLESAIAKHLPNMQPRCFNMALPGAMISDDYMVARSLLTGAHKPKILVLGLSPRDFIDSGFKYPACSDHYRYLQHFIKSDDLVELAMPEIWQRFSYYIHNTAYLDANKSDLQVIGGELSKRALSVSTAKARQVCQFNKKNTDARLAIYQSEMESGVWIAHPHGRDYYHETELEKLARRYSHPSQANYKNQKQWLELCLELCKKEGIQPIIVNVPLTEKNVALFAPGIYHNCVDTMIAESQKFNCPFLDLQNPKEFVLTDFTDMCHMDASGGKKLLDHVAQAIAEDRRMIAAMRSGGSKVALSGQRGVQ